MLLIHRRGFRTSHHGDTTSQRVAGPLDVPYVCYENQNIQHIYECLYSPSWTGTENRCSPIPCVQDELKIYKNNKSLKKNNTMLMSCFLCHFATWHCLVSAIFLGVSTLCVTRTKCDQTLKHMSNQMIHHRPKKIVRKKNGRFLHQFFSSICW